MSVMNMTTFCHVLTLDRQAYVQTQTVLLKADIGTVPLGAGIETVALGVEAGTVPLTAGIWVA
ncbi:uncharacterized protein N7503_002164 [Penicillium pulvis]|uniref:uncharacterized protein n=1 Tax=Penicillium pulvis TaxID=1562058 RepID=UPI002546923A|nr:uncharacterized protein N7503_002164 [Penicillium pulvis]KAJ5809946.1 hypothetical protein N7503_002164 [Penicillium pulvis]